MIKGSYVAIVTPFKGNNVDYSAVDRLLDFHLGNSTDGIVLCGTTGESPTLAGDEKEYFVKYCIRKIDRKIPVMVGSGTNNLVHTLSMTKRAQEWGADSALVITPYYNKPTQKGMYEFFKAVAQAVDIPIIIYNVPGRTGVDINADTVIRLANEFSNIIAVKEASGNLVKASQIVKYTNSDFSLLSGEDALTFPLMCCGAKGVVSVTANIVPQKMHDMTFAALENDYDTARKIHLDLLELHDAMFMETNPIPVKEALHFMGLIEREIRLPLTLMDSSNLEKLKSILFKYSLVKH